MTDPYIPHETFRRSNVGVDIIGWRPINFKVAGIRIDNPSGSWLFVDIIGMQLQNQFVPPYTIGWQSDPPYPVPEISVSFVDGPAGQISTQAGDPITIWVYNRPIGNSPGHPFITEFTPNFANIMAATDVPLSTGLSGNLIPGTAGRRIRLTAISVALGGFPANPFSIRRAISPVTWTLIDTVTFDNRLVGRVTPESPVDARSFVPGIDFPEFAALTFTASTDFADSRIGVSANSQLI